MSNFRMNMAEEVPTSYPPTRAVTNQRKYSDMIRIVERNMEQTKQKMEDELLDMRRELYDEKFQLKNAKRELLDFQQRFLAEQTARIRAQNELETLNVARGPFIDTVELESQLRYWQNSSASHQARSFDLECDISKLKSQLKKAETRARDEINRRLACEKRTRQREKNKFAADKVAEALAKRNKEVEDEIDKRVAERLAAAEKQPPLAEPSPPPPNLNTDTVVAIVRNDVAVARATVVKKHEALLNKARRYDAEDTLGHTDETRCTICKVQKSCVRYAPCNHTVTCGDCACRMILMYSSTCQLCRREISDFSKV